MKVLTDFFRSIRTISDDECAIINSYFKTEDHNEGEYLFTGGRVCGKLFFIASGVVRIVATNEKGVDVTHYFIRERQFCTLLESFNNGTIAQDSIQACCNTSVLSISKTKLEDLYKKLPFMIDLIKEVNQQRMLDKIRLKNAYSGEDAAGRFKVFLSEQSDIANRVPLNYIASYLNVTPQSLSRIRRELK